MKRLFSNKFLWISAGAILLFFALVCSVYAGYKQIDWRFFGADSVTFNAPGNSMYPTIPENAQELCGYKVDPQVNDVVTFICSKPECINYNGEIHSGNLTKRLIKIREDGAWWVEGDNKATSFDSRYFGWILPGERSDVLVVKIK